MFSKDQYFPKDKYTVESFLDVIKLFYGKDMITFLNEHQGACCLFTNVNEAIQFANTVLRIVGKDRENETYELIASILNPLFTKLNIIAMIEFLKETNVTYLPNLRNKMKSAILNVSDLVQVIEATKSKCYSFAFIRSLDHLFKDFSCLRKVLPYLTDKDKKDEVTVLSYLKTKYHLFNELSEVSEAAKILDKSPERLELISCVESHWELKRRAQCRMLFLGSGKHQKTLQFFFNPGENSNFIKKQILDLAGLDRYKSKDGTISEEVYTLLKC